MALIPLPHLHNWRDLFVGPVCNPIAEARLEDGKSVTSLANKLGVSKQYVSRAEHGTYSSLNEALVKYGSSQLKIKPGDFVRRYQAFQEAVRKDTVDNVNPNLLARRGSTATGNEIFSRWRNGYWNSITEFCNAFCIHPEIVRAYEDGIRDEMPAIIRNVLGRFGVIDPNWNDDPAAPATNEHLTRNAYLDHAKNTIETLKEYPNVPKS